MKSFILSLTFLYEILCSPCFSTLQIPTDPIDSTLIQKNFVNQNIVGFGMWHRFIPMLRPELLKTTENPKLQLFVELDNQKTARFAVYLYNFLDDKQFLVRLDLYSIYETWNYFALDPVLIEGKWAYAYYCQKQNGATYDYALYYYMIVDANNKYSYQITGQDVNRGYTGDTFYSQSLVSNVNQKYHQYLGYKGELQFKSVFYTTIDQFVADISVACDFPDFCSAGATTNMLITSIANQAKGEKQYEITFYETNYAISGWIKLDALTSTRNFANTTALRLALLPYYADDYMQGDRQMILIYSQNYKNPENTQIQINTFSFIYASLTFYKTKEDDIWSVQGTKYEDEITKWHYFSFQHGQSVVDEVGYANTKIYFKFSSFEIIDYYLERKNHFTTQISQLMTGKDKYNAELMQGYLAFIKLDYCYGNTYSLVIDCHKLCSTCLGPESNQCTVCYSATQFRILAENECLCKRNFNSNTDPSNYICEDMITQLGGNIISQIPLTNKCNEGQFLIKMNGQEICSNCPSPKGQFTIECTECQLNPYFWYLNPICQSDYQTFEQSATSAYQYTQRLSHQYTLYFISDQMELELCYGCEQFIDNQGELTNVVKRNHLGQETLIKCKSCYASINNECILQNENCETCDTSYKCTQCQVGFQLLSNTFCKQCPSICPDCTISGEDAVCTECPKNYYLSKGSCLQCGVNCSICDATRCYKCVDTSLYYISLDGKNCYSNPIANCQIAYEENISNSTIISLKKNYETITQSDQAIVKCALCDLKTTNYLTNCQIDNTLQSDQRAIMFNGVKTILSFQIVNQGSYFQASQSSYFECDASLNCRKCIFEDVFYQDSWKWDIQSYYDTLYGSSFLSDIEKTDTGYVKCLICLAGYELYDGKCVTKCPDNCKRCQFLNGIAQCVECKINQNGQQLSLSNNICIECPYNCALCKSRSDDIIYALNPYFNPDYDEFKIYSYVCLKSYDIVGTYLNYDFDLVNYVDCQDANTCQQIAVIDQNIYCEEQLTYSNYDKYIGDLTISKYEQQKVLKILNQKVVKKITIKMTLVKGTGECIFPQDFQIISKLRSNIFSLLEINLEFEGTTDVILNQNFAISGFNKILMKNFDIVSNSKTQQLHLYDPISFELTFLNINVKVTDIKFQFLIENATKIDITSFSIKDSSLLNTDGLISIYGQLNNQNININLQQVEIKTNSFQNSTIFLFYLSENYNKQIILINQFAFENNIYTDDSYAFRTYFTLNIRQSSVLITDLTQKSDSFSASIFANFEGTKLVDIQQILLESTTFSLGSYWMILPLFKINNLIVKENYLSTDDVTLISNKASVQYSDAASGNQVELKTVNFENNKYIGNKAFIEIYQSTFLNMAVVIDELVLNQNYLHTLNKLSSKYIASENSTIYLDIDNLILTNTQIIRSKSFPELAVLNGDKVKISNFNVQRNSDSLRLLNNYLTCVSANIIPQAYTTILYIYNLKEIEIDQMILEGIKSINQPLIQIKSSDRLNIRQSEKITITNSYFAENLLILSKISEVQAIISIISEQNQKVVITDTKFLYNYQHSYVSDLSFVSSSTLLFQSPNSTIELNRMNFEKNIATNGQNSNLVLKCNSILIETCSFLQSNQLEFRMIRENIVWGLGENYVPRQEEYYQAFPIKTFGGSAYLSANTTIIDNVNVIGSKSLLGGGFYLLPESSGILQFSNILFLNCQASLEQVSNAQGGSIFIDASSSNLQAKFQNCTFENSYSRRDGGVIYIIPSNENNNMQMQDIVIQDSYSIYYSFLKVFGSNYFNFVAENFKLINSYNGFKQYLGQLYQLSQTELSDYQNNYIFSFSGSLKLYNATITDYMNGLFQISSGILELISVTINNFTMSSQPLLDLSIMSLINLQKVLFFNISLYSQITDVVSTCEVSYQSLPLDCDYTQEVPTFIDYDMNQTIIEYYSILNIKNIQKVQSSPTSFISIRNILQNDQITIQDTLFQQITCSTCQSGLILMQFTDFYELGKNTVTLENIKLMNSICGLISCFQFQHNSRRLLQSDNRILVSDKAKSSVVYTVKVFLSSFLNNQGTNGGVFYVDDINIVFDKCQFTSNIAQEAGGTIYFISKQATMNIYDSEANNNTAKIGGAFFLSNYTLNSPAMLNIQLRNNLASKFGQNYAEYPNQLTLSLDGGKNFLEKSVLFSNTTTIIDLITIKPYNVSSEQKTYLTLPSGQAINSYKYFDEATQQFISYNLTFRIIALNKQENKIENLDGTKCSIFSKRINISDQNLADTVAIDNQTIQSPFTSFQEIQFNTLTQDYNLDDMIVFFDPKQNSKAVLQLEFLCSSVRIPIFESDPPYLMKYQIENYRLRVNVQSFDCQVGEQKRDEDGTCLVCDSQQDQYSVQAGESCQIKDTISTEEVTSASVKLRAGYWRPYTYSTKIEYCLNMPINCEGGWSPGDQSCYTGHIGALCEQCDIYNIHLNGAWSVSTQYKCGSCNELGDNTIKVVLISTWTIISIMLSVKSTMETVNNMVLGKRFSKYFVEQPKTGYGGILIKVLTNYLQIIGVVATFQLSLPSAITSGFKTVGSPVESMSYSLDCFLINLTEINIMYFRMIWALIMPIIYIVTFFILYGVAVLLGMATASKSAITTTFIYLFTFLQPTLLGGFISLLSFRQISNIYWVQGNVAYRYDTPQHLKWVLTFVLPSTFTLALIIPIYMFVSLFRVKDKLDDESSRKNWGYLYNEYQPKAFFWEIVKIFQKSFIIIFLTFYEDLIIIKAALIFIIVFIYSLLTKKYRPYKLPYLNYLDDVSTLVCGTSIVLSMTLYSANLTDNQEIIWPFYIFLLFINGVFLAAVIWEILWAQLEGQQEALDKIRSKINAKFPNIQNSNWLLRKLLTNRSEQKKRVKARWRKIREYLMGHIKSVNRKRDHLNFVPDESFKEKNNENSFTTPEINPSILSVPRFYNKIYPEIHVEQFEHSPQQELSQEAF